MIIVQLREKQSVYFVHLVTTLINLSFTIVQKQ